MTPIILTLLFVAALVLRLWGTREFIEKGHILRGFLMDQAGSAMWGGILWWHLGWHLGCNLWLYGSFTIMLLSSFSQRVTYQHTIWGMSLFFAGCLVFWKG